MQFTSFAQGEFDLGDPPLVEIHSQGNERQSLFPGAADELVEFAFVDQQLAGTLRFMIPEGRLRILGDVASDQPQDAPFYPTVGLIELTLAIAQALDFAPLEHEAAFHRVENLVLVPRLAIFADDPRHWHARGT